MLASLLALGSAVGWGCSDFLGGREGARSGVLRVLVISQAVSLAVLVGGALVLAPVPSTWGALGWAAGAGLAEAVGVSALYRGLAVGAAGVVSPASATAPVVPLAVVVAGGTTPAALQLLGIVVIVGGMVSAAAEPGRNTALRQQLPGLGYGAISALGFGAYFVAMARASSSGVPWSLVGARGTCLLLVVVALMVTGQRFRAEHVAPRRLAVAVVIGFLVVAGDGLYAASTTRGELALVAVLSAAHPVVTIVLSRVVDHERLSRVRWAGITLTLLGVVAVST